MGYLLRSDWSFGPGARKDLAGAFQGHPFCEVWKPFQGTLFGVSRECVWAASRAVFCSRFCMESVQNCERIPYTILYRVRTQKFARAIFFLRRPDFRGQNSTQIFGTDSDPDFCTDSVHKATECEPARTGATWAVRTPCTDSVHIFGRFLNQILGFGIRGKPFCQI